MNTLGAIPNLKDLRDIHLAQVQTPVSVPFKYSTDISWIPVFNQKSIGSCVGHAHAVIHIYNEFKENGKIPNLSPRYIYALSKKLDNYKGQGTYPRVSAGIEFRKGCATENLVPNNNDLTHEQYIDIIETPEMKANAKPYRIKGYAGNIKTTNQLKDAILQNGLVAVTISVGGYTSPIKKGNLGYHRVVAFGWEGNRFFFRNSWGEAWGNKGDGFFDFADQRLIDNMVFIDLPNEIIEEAKKKYKYFSTKEILGLKPELVVLLDKARGLAGIPFVINSGVRTKKHNDEVKGVTNSSHLTGKAVDIRARNSSEHFKITKALLEVGFTRLSRRYPNHIHCDIDFTKPQNVLF